jgi:hypothetical protein
MKKLTFFAFLVCVPLCLFPMPTPAQGNGVAPTGNGGNHTLEGQVYLPSGRRIDTPVRVKLQSDGAGGELTVTTSAFGTFTFLYIAPGNYTVTIEGTDDYERATEHVFIDKDTGQSSSGATPASATGQRHTVIVHLRP